MKEGHHVAHWIQQPIAKKALAIAIFALFVFALRHVLNLIFLTFIFIYLFYSLHRLFEKKTKFPPRLLLLLLYVVFLGLLAIVGYTYAPIVFVQLGEVFTQISRFSITDYQDILHPIVYQFVAEMNIGSYLSELGDHALSSIANISGFLIELVIALVLSFFFNLERDKVKLFAKRLESSNVSFLYEIYKEFGANFLNTFGKVVQVQFMIASANAILSFFGLWILGFPALMGLTIMIFFLGLIPVAGVIISFIPLSIIAFQIGGVIKILQVIVVILVIHAMENYFLNPKLYSVRMKLPIFVTFAVLIVSEEIMGIWGLLLGMPFFMFILNLFKMDYITPKK